MIPTLLETQSCDPIPSASAYKTCPLPRFETTFCTIARILRQLTVQFSEMAWRCSDISNINLVKNLKGMLRLLLHFVFLMKLLQKKITKLIIIQILAFIATNLVACCRVSHILVMFLQTTRLPHHFK
jgi:hypothetical protein